MTRTTARALSADLRRISRRLTVAIGCETNPFIKPLLQVVYDVCTSALALTDAELRRAVDAEQGEVAP